MSTRIIFIRSLLLVSGITVSTISSVQAQESSDALIAKGKELYFEQVSCWVCHGDEAEGRIGPTIAYGPTPAQTMMKATQWWSGIRAGFTMELIRQRVARYWINHWKLLLADIA